jgi:hypothetical protein
MDPLTATLQDVADELHAALVEYAEIWVEDRNERSPEVIIEVTGVNTTFALSVRVQRDAETGEVEPPSPEVLAQVLHAHGGLDDRNDPTGVQRAVWTILKASDVPLAPVEILAPLAELGFERKPNSVHSLLSRMWSRGRLARSEGRYDLPERSRAP